MTWRADVTSSPAARVTVPHRERPSISFVTVTYGTRSSVIDRCLEQLATSIAAGGIDAEFVVVDNPHPEAGGRTANHLALTTSGVVLIRADRNLGFGGGNELGIMHARGEVICLLNPDLFVHPGWLAPLLAALERTPDAIVAPILVTPDRSSREAGQRVLPNGLTRPVAGAEAPHYASAACWLFRRWAWERTGGFDARFHPAYFEDVDLSFRWCRLGGTLEMVGTEVVHAHGGSTREAPPDVSTQIATLVEIWRDELRYVAVDAPASMANSSSTP